MISSVVKHLLLLLVPALTGCAGSPATAVNGASLLTWPLNMSEPRIQWVGEIRTPLDAGIRKSVWRKVVELVSGEEIERIVKPYGIYVDSRKRIFVADAGSHTLHMFDAKANKYAALIPADKRQFATLIGVTGDDADNIYMTDAKAGTVYRYSSANRSITPFLAGSLQRPTGIAFNRSNKLLYITDTTSHKIVIYDLQKKERYRIGFRSDAPGGFNFPTDLSIDAAGDISVTDALNSRIQMFTSAGKFLGMFGSEGDIPGYFGKPKGNATDSDGNIYICDALQDIVQIFDRKGNLLLTFGETGRGPGQFWMPSGIFIDGDDTIYVADTYNNRIQIFKYLKLLQPGSLPSRVKRG